jgi:hypothetical protein
MSPSRHWIANFSSDDKPQNASVRGADPDGSSGTLSLHSLSANVNIFSLCPHKKKEERDLRGTEGVYTVKVTILRGYTETEEYALMQIVRTNPRKNSNKKSKAIPVTGRGGL